MESFAKFTFASDLIPVKACGKILVIDAGRESVCNAVVRNCVPMVFIILSSEKETVFRDVQFRNTLSSIKEIFAGIYIRVNLEQSSNADVPIVSSIESGVTLTDSNDVHDSNADASNEVVAEGMSNAVSAEQS